MSEVPSLPASQDYLKDFWPDLQAAQELHGSICQALQEKESEGSQREFAEHLPAEVLEAGIKSGRYVKVQPANLLRAWGVFVGGAWFQDCGGRQLHNRASSRAVFRAVIRTVPRGH